jgi:predicted nucleic acid-binding protein
MTRIFLDSSVLYSAAYSPTGHSRDLIIMAARGEITIVISNLVVDETRRNIAEKAPNHVSYLDLIFENIPFEFTKPTAREVKEATKHIVLKDAPIAAAAKKAKVDLLVTLDKKHLLDKPEIAKYVGADIVTPKEAISRLAFSN